MALRHAGIECKVQLAEVSPASPDPQRTAEGWAVGRGHSDKIPRCWSSMTSQVIEETLARSSNRPMEDIITLNTGQPDHGRLLRTALLVNALYSGLSGAALVAASPFIGPWVGLDGWVLLTGRELAVEIRAILAIARQQARCLRIVGRLAAGADLIWVIGAAALILVRAMCSPVRGVSDSRSSPEAWGSLPPSKSSA